MCKYCKLKKPSADVDELMNDFPIIVMIKDGTQEIDLSFDRYQAAETKSTLSLELGINIDGCYYGLKRKEIKIKYCPFCGEKL